MDQQLAMAIHTASTWVVPVVLAITLHEAAHGFVAHWFGDDTAWRQGRVSLNPLKHVDPFGTIVLPAMLLLLRAPFLFGYAKPVPVNFARAAPASPRHGVGRGGRAGGKPSDGDCGGPDGPPCRPSAGGCPRMASAESAECDSHQCHACRLQHDPVAAPRWRPCRRQACCRTGSPCRSPGWSVMAC